jgi:uncharacterized membrane protein
LSVVFATMLVAAVLKEPLHWPQYAGGGLIVAGAILLAWG